MIKNDLQSTVSKAEIAKFELIAEDWWNPEGKFKPLHDLTPKRLEYIISLAKEFFKIDNFDDLKVLDIGCGGGLISEPFARLKAKVTGIDASAVNIKIANAHKGDLDIHYQQILAEDLIKTQNKYDLILALEILEHVENIDLFINACASLLKPNGLIIFSTINRTITSYLRAIIGAEYILQWLPVGTHDWSKFLRPSEISTYAIKNNLKLYDIKGLDYSIINQEWNLSNNIKNNYFIAFCR